MIKFFRKIRHRLLTENKFSKYLLYAIGEIVLVVIGILLALQINNWNESRKAFNLELQLYGNLVADLNNSFRITNNYIMDFKGYQNTHQRLYNETQEKLTPPSNNSYNPLEWVIYFHLDITEKYSTSLTNITNDSIRDLLKNYIRQEKGTKDAFDEWNKLKEQRLRPFFNKHGIHNTEEVYNDSNLYDFFPMTSNVLLEKDKLKEQFGTTELDELLFDLRFKTSWVYSNLDNLKNANNNLEHVLVNNLSKTEHGKYIKRIPRKSISDLVSSNTTIDEIIEIIKKDDKNEPVYIISEREINSFGYLLMEQNKNEEGLKIFKLNTELYPNAYNTYDSYGECLLILGDKENGIKAYKKSLELNPNNSHAKDVISELKNP